MEDLADAHSEDENGNMNNTAQVSGTTEAEEIDTATPARLQGPQTLPGIKIFTCQPPPDELQPEREANGRDWMGDLPPPPEYEYWTASQQAHDREEAHCGGQWSQHLPWQPWRRINGAALPGSASELSCKAKRHADQSMPIYLLKPSSGTS